MENATYTYEGNYFLVSNPVGLSTITAGSSLFGLKGSTYSDNNNNKIMKESNKTKFKIVFQETTVRNYIYDVLAESEADAVDKIGKGEYGSSSTNNLISVVTTQLK